MAIPTNDWYTIKSGDTLSKIAKEAGIPDWKTIYNDPQNADFRKKRPDPDKIYPGDKIWIPGTPKTSTGKKTVFVISRVLHASIVQIEGDTDISVAYAKKKVMKPHWKEGETVDDSYKDGGASIDCSKKPAIFSLKDKAARLKVKLNISKLTVSGDCKLTGILEGLKFEATFRGEEGEKEVIAEAVTSPTTQKWYKGDMQWELYPVYYPSEKISLAATRLELFFILDKPKPLYKANGVWTEVLRFLFQKVNLDGTDTDEKAAAKITSFFHSKFGLTYDTSYGAPAYTLGINDTTNTVDEFKLMFFMEKNRGNTVNCYDEASAVQSFCAAIGIGTQWLFCEPFGFITTTNLVGVGSCNNPFFKSNGSSKIVPQNDSKRTGFGNHAFCGIEINKQDNVLDACAGPHLGNESRKKYLDNSIDRAMGGDGDISDIKNFKEVLTIG